MPETNTPLPKEYKSRIAIDRIVDLAETRDIRPVDHDHAACLAVAVEKLPPVDVVKLNGSRFGLLAGYHRREAHQVAQVKTMRVVVHDLDPEQWFLFAVRSNLEHGLPLTMPQRKAAAKRMLEEDPHRSDRDIAADCGLTHPTIAKLRRPDPDDDPTGNTYQLNPETRIGRDGKARHLPTQPRTSDPTPDEWAAREDGETPDGGVKDLRLQEDGKPELAEARELNAKIGLANACDLIARLNVTLADEDVLRIAPQAGGELPDPLEVSMLITRLQPLTGGD
jgi:hypothetical protein